MTPDAPVGIVHYMVNYQERQLDRIFAALVDGTRRAILARLEREGLTLSAEADRATLLRRVSLDLVGLPPTPEEVDAFQAEARHSAMVQFPGGYIAELHSLAAR